MQNLANWSRVISSFVSPNFYILSCPILAPLRNKKMINSGAQILLYPLETKHHPHPSKLGNFREVRDSNMAVWCRQTSNHFVGQECQNSTDKVWINFTVGKENKCDFVDRALWANLTNLCGFHCWASLFFK